MNHNLIYSRDCKYCPGNYLIYWDSKTEKYYDDSEFTIAHKRHNLNNVDNEELKQIKKIQKSLLRKVQYMDEDLKKIKNKLGLNDVQ